MKNTIMRLYSGSDAHMLEQAGIIRKVLENNLADFTAFDATLDEGFVAAFGNSIENAFVVPKNSTGLSATKMATKSITNCMAEGRRRYKDLLFFATQRAFPKDAQKAKEFGRQLFRNARNTPPKFTEFLDVTLKVAEKYKPQLLAVGYKTTDFEALAQASKAITAASVQQHGTKSARPSQTAERITVLNNCYSNIQLVRSAAKCIYVDNPLKLAMFKYERKKSKPRKKGDDGGGQR